MALGRTACDAGGDFEAALPRTFFVIDPTSSGDKRSILLVEPVGTDAECADAAKKCKQAAAGLLFDVKCVRASSLPVYAATSKLLTMSVPDPATAKLAIDGGPLTIAVADQSADFSKCKDLATANACSALEGTKDKSWKICIDTLFRDNDANPTCKHDDENGQFPGLTLLPVWNAFDELCFAKKKYCKRTGADLPLRYAVDDDENMLIPIDWRGSLAGCGGTAPCGLEVSGALVAPDGRVFDLPANSGRTNDLLQSFTPEGRKNNPQFFVDAKPKAGVVLLGGRTDEPTSVLRIATSVKQCFANGVSTGRGCRKHGNCRAGEKCWPPCLGGSADGKPCDNRANEDACRAGNGRCGRAHDMVDAHDKGRWYFKRNDGALCEAEKITDVCPTGQCPAATPCVRYQAVASSPFVPSTPSPTATPGDEMERSLENLLKRFRAAGGESRPRLGHLTRSQNGKWAAAVATIDSSGPGDDAGGQDSFLVVASTQCSADTVVCGVGTVKLPTPPLDHAVAFHEDQLRFLTVDPDASQQDNSGLPRSAVLWVADLAVPGCCDEVNASRVGRVLMDNVNYDPLVEIPGGGTVYLTPAGRCYAGEEMLLVPSFCRPAAGDCPGGAECRPAPVAIAIDLMTDSNNDGVPDSLQQRGE